MEKANREYKLPLHFHSAIGRRDNWSLIVRSPGRINIIGEHLDYNGGPVLPAAIEQGVFFAIRPSKDRQYHFMALDIEERVSLAAIPELKSGPGWFDYLAGIINQFKAKGFDLAPVEVIFGGNLPQGAGVSSSAALEGGMALVCNEICSAGLSRPELARICKASSNSYMGIPSGIMDQFASLNGRDGQAILLDCNSLEHEFVDAGINGYQFMLVNSMVTHELSSSEYPLRVAECEEGLEVLQRTYPTLEVLALASPEMVEAVKDEMRELVYHRCRYVAGERQRLQRAVEALRFGDAPALGRELNATHTGLRDDYAVSCTEIDFLQDFAENFNGVAGSRLMGGGFGGCTINLVATEQVDAFTTAVKAAYLDKFRLKAIVFPALIAGGSEVIFRKK
ncbi:galactokinase [Lewinellaceae bacterium SD302]|nr:galactokinase [Lewinellaceae bacterium SD302]